MLALRKVRGWVRFRAVRWHSIKKNICHLTVTMSSLGHLAPTPQLIRKATEVVLPSALALAS